mgnify:CR=1 FL=1
MLYFTLFRVADPFRHLYSCMSRRGEEEKTKNFFGVSPSQKRLNDFQLYSVSVSYLKEIRVALLVMMEEFRKETLWCESRKTDLHDTQNAGIVD